MSDTTTWSVRDVAGIAQFRSYWVATVADSVAAGLWSATLLWVGAGAANHIAGSLVIAAGVAPALLLAPFGGIVVDRVGSGRILVVTTALRTVLLAVWAVLGVGDVDNLVLLGLVAMGFDGLAGLHNPAIGAYVSTFLPPDAAPAARSAEATGQRVAQLVGIALGGSLLAASLGRAVVGTVAVAASLLGFVLYALIYRSAGDRTGSQARSRVGGEPFGRRVLRGLQIIGQHVVLRRTITTQLVGSAMAEGAVIVGVPFLIREHQLPGIAFPLGVTATFLGVFVGTLATALRVERIGHLPRHGLLAFGSAAVAIVAIGLIGGRAWPVTVLLAGAVGFGMASGGPALTGWAGRQVQTMAERNGEAVMGRFSAVIAIAMQADNVGVIAVGVLAAWWGIDAAIVAFGVVLLLTVAWGLSARAVREA
ncbi:MFS transporter [Flexivirga meconopsidis]|uniref:MFS transporter n=1 Tax=Flexivirga meconopsidis TaxID=2977121 RepID=UPI0022402014|nr:MFS transporter [Flexivirga meconopsidis]